MFVLRLHQVNSTFTVCYTQLINDIHTVGVCVCVWCSVMGEGGVKSIVLSSTPEVMWSIMASFTLYALCGGQVCLHGTSTWEMLTFSWLELTSFIAYR